jgi:hypothetical protein
MLFNSRKSGIDRRNSRSDKVNQNLLHERINGQGKNQKKSTL